MGKQPVTIYDIAFAAKVSQSTVSRVLSGGARVSPVKAAAVRAAVEALGYKPNVAAKGLAKGRSMTIGVLTVERSNPFFGQVLQGIERGLRGTEWNPVVATVAGQDGARRALDRLLALRIDALLVVGEAIRDDRIARLPREMPVVAVGPSAGLDDRCLHADNLGGATMAVRHLVQLGHRRIAHVTGPVGHRHAVDRQEGYARALAEAGIAIDPALIVNARFDERSGLEATQELLDRGHDFTALFAGNDQMAYGARLALHRRGLRVPEDVSLVGFDDQPLSSFTIPPLTTVRQPIDEMGAAAVSGLIAMLGGNDWPVPTLPTELVIRDSTAPPPKR